MATLYREYRPQNFKEVVGQNHVKITLEHEIESGRIAHAYLFCGPRGIGKTTVARVFAKAINCKNRKEGEHDPCNKCDSCRDITIGRSMDIIEVDAASHTGVDNVRENIIAASRVAPSVSKYKVFIIDEVHMLSASAFNALLKVLEEPPQRVVFILCTTEAHKIPATIISRCQRFDLKRISTTEITKKLQFVAREEGIKIDKKILESIARHSEGHMRDAESLLGQVVSIGGKEITAEEADLVIPRSDLREVIKLIEFLGQKDAGGGIGLVNKAIDDGIDLKRFLIDLIEMLRKIMLSKINPALSEKWGSELGESMEIEISKASREFDLRRIIEAIEKFNQAKNKISESFITQLPIEIAITELCLAPASPVFTPQATPPKTAPVVNSQEPVKTSNAPIVKNGEKVNKEVILNRWSEVLARVKTYNHSLSFILRACQPRDVNGNQLCLAFKYKFHKDRIDETNIRQIVEKVLMEVYGQNITIEAVIDEGMESADMGSTSLPQEEKNVPENISDAKNVDTQIKNEDKGGNDEKNMIDNLLKTFGGKVVE